MDFTDLLTYKKGFSLAMEIYEISNSFPKEESYSLIDKIRRPSRSVCSNIAEAYRKRKYPKHFSSKLTDSDGENSETRVWWEFALACEYINQTTFDALESKNREIGKLINYMILNPKKFGSSELD